MLLYNQRKKTCTNDCSLFIFDKLTAFIAMLDGCLYYFSKCTFLDPFATDELCAAILILTENHYL